jgi:hypothetical protein
MWDVTVHHGPTPDSLASRVSEAKALVRQRYPGVAGEVLADEIDSAVNLRWLAESLPGCRSLRLIRHLLGEDEEAAA